ncbi:MAG: CDP-alcohol phosphatidyltransferase family protein [Solirubrobacterales bacterium]
MTLRFSQRFESDLSRPLLLAATSARLCLVPIMMVSFMSDPRVTTLALGSFMVMDLMDGVVARRQGVDDARRRAVDSLVDHVAIDLCLIAAMLQGALPLPILIGFLLRDAYCGAICTWLLRDKRRVIKVDLPYRIPSYLISAWALSAPFLSASHRAVFALCVLAFSFFTAADLTRLSRRIRKSRAGDQLALVAATAARGQLEKPEEVDSELAAEHSTSVGSALVAV